MNPIKTLASANRWRDQYNPLRNLTMARAVSLMEDAQRGVMADLQWLYASELGIEATDADLMTIIERTVAGVSDMDWQIVTADDQMLGFDQALADEQRDFLEASYNACDNLSDAIEHLVMARFRGFSHLQPWLKPDWTIEHLEPLPQWNMVRDGTSSRWAWNRAAHQKPYRSLAPDAALDPADYILLENRRPVNRIALIKYIRSTVAEKDWDAYVEIYGIPGVFIIMPPNIPEGKEAEYRDRAVDAAEAASGALPNGSDVKTLAEVRGVQPFQMRLEWLQKQLVLAGTGGMLTMLSEPTGIGSGASGTHEGVWQTIIRRVARKVELPFNCQYDRRALAAVFPGRPQLAFFSLRAKQEKDVGSAVSSIAQLASAGYQVDPEQVEAETGYKVTLKAPETPDPGMNWPRFASLNAHTPFKTHENVFKNAPSILNAQGDPPPPPPAQIAKNRPSGADAILADLAATILDGSVPFEDALKAAQEKLDQADLNALSSGLEAALEGAMYEAAATAAGGPRSVATAEVANMREYKRERDGKFAEVDNPADFEPGDNPDSAETQAAEIGKGKKAIEKCLAEGVDVHDAVSRGDIGTISLRYGDEKGGLAHFKDRKEAVEHLAQTLVQGKAGKPYQQGQKLNLTHGGFVATLRLTEDKKDGLPKNWVLTSFGPNDKKEGANN